MALWRDPLDDLIADLEPSTARAELQLPFPVEDLICCVDVILYGTDDAQERLKTDARFLRVKAQMARVASGNGKR